MLFTGVTIDPGDIESVFVFLRKCELRIFKFYFCIKYSLFPCVLKSWCVIQCLSPLTLLRIFDTELCFINLFYGKEGLCADFSLLLPAKSLNFSTIGTNLVALPCI